MMAKVKVEKSERAARKRGHHECSDSKRDAARPVHDTVDLTEEDVPAPAMKRIKVPHLPQRT